MKKYTHKIYKINFEQPTIKKRKKKKNDQLDKTYLFMIVCGS